MCPNLGNYDSLNKKISVSCAVEKVDGVNCHKCSCCPYVCQITKTVSKEAPIAVARKQVDDVLGGVEAWKNVQKTAVVCEACGNKEAYFREIQTRSADEPATLFFRCTACGKVWKEN